MNICCPYEIVIIEVLQTEIAICFPTLGAGKLVS